MTEFHDVVGKYTILLGSKSPRRNKLLSDLGLPFKMLPVIETDEHFPESMPHEEIPVHIAKQKAAAYSHYLDDHTVLITADTIVSLNNEILGKPNNIDNARLLLQKISGKCHQVVSGVCLTSLIKQSCFKAITNVYFKTLTKQEIDFYLEHFQPLDKAGAYGIQEWIGLIGVEAIEGSFYNVMGLPVQKLYMELIKFCHE